MIRCFLGFHKWIRTKSYSTMKHELVCKRCYLTENEFVDNKREREKKMSDYKKTDHITQESIDQSKLRNVEERLAVAQAKLEARGVRDAICTKDNDDHKAPKELRREVTSRRGLDVEEN